MYHNTVKHQQRTMKLRGYQEQAVADARKAASAGKNPVIQLPTGAGKSLIGAELCRHFGAIGESVGSGALSLTHTRELIRQNAECFDRYMDGRMPYGIYSAGLGAKSLGDPVTFAGVQSYCRLRPGDVHERHALIIDEAHRIPRESQTQYGQCLALHPGVPRIGLTATPYRADSGLLVEGEDALFDTLIQPVTTADLQSSGFLSPLSGIVSRDSIDTTGVHIRGGEFINSELEQIATDDTCVDRVCRAILAHSDGRRAILVFGVSIAHSEALSRRLNELGCPSAFIHGQLAADERDSVLHAFGNGRFRALINCMILTTGYDYPGIDCIAVVRPTMSRSLWVQMVGRGLRRSEGKEDCKILDFGGNWRRHGRELDGMPESSVVDEPVEDCAQLREKKRNSEKSERKYAFALDDSPVELQELRVFEIRYFLERNRKNPSLEQIRVNYRTDGGRVTIWLMPEHATGARWHAARWFARRGIKMPATAREAYKLACAAHWPESIHAERDGDFWRVKIEHFAFGE